MLDFNTDPVQIDRLTNTIHSFNQGCHKQDIRASIQLLTNEFTIYHNATGRKMPALAIDENGTIMFAKSAVKTYFGESRLKGVCRDLLSVTCDRDTHIMYGRTRELNPFVWEMIRVVVTDWRYLNDTERDQFRSRMIVFNNGLHGNEIDLTITQNLLDSVADMRGQPRMAVKDIFDDGESGVFEPGMLESSAVHRFLKRAWISQSVLLKLGHSITPLPCVVDESILLHTPQEVRQQLRVYPLVFQAIYAPRQHAKQITRKLKSRSADVMISTAVKNIVSEYGYNTPVARHNYSALHGQVDDLSESVTAMTLANKKRARSLDSEDDSQQVLYEIQTKQRRIEMRYADQMEQDNAHQLAMIDGDDDDDDNDNDDADNDDDDNDDNDRHRSSMDEESDHESESDLESNAMDQDDRVTLSQSQDVEAVVVDSNNNIAIESV
jgi:hypothetical protein